MGRLALIGTAAAVAAVFFLPAAAAWLRQPDAQPLPEPVQLSDSRESRQPAAGTPSRRVRSKPARSRALRPAAKDRRPAPAAGARPAELTPAPAGRARPRVSPSPPPAARKSPPPPAPVVRAAEPLAEPDDDDEYDDDAPDDEVAEGDDYDD